MQHVAARGYPMPLACLLHTRARANLGVEAAGLGVLVERIDPCLPRDQLEPAKNSLEDNFLFMYMHTLYPQVP
jgi:hypothetical protein